MNVGKKWYLLSDPDHPPVGILYTETKYICIKKQIANYEII